MPAGPGSLASVDSALLRGWLYGRVAAHGLGDKMVTATTALRLVERGEVRLDQPLIEVLPAEHRTSALTGARTPASPAGTYVRAAELPGRRGGHAGRVSLVLGPGAVSAGAAAGGSAATRRTLIGAPPVGALHPATAEHADDNSLTKIETRKPVAGTRHLYASWLLQTGSHRSCHALCS
jgi:CubicO group peptidase (beta-lactamase class C family)